MSEGPEVRRTADRLAEVETANRWEYTHWVFRRGGRPCWKCGTRILTDRKQSARVTFWCPSCQPLPVPVVETTERRKPRNRRPSTAPRRRAQQL